MNKTLIKLFAATVFLGFANIASASLVWDNGSGNTNEGGYCGSCGAVDAYTMFDDFTLSDSLASATLEWDASFANFDSATGAVRIGVWSDYNSGQLWSELFNYADLTLVSNNTNGWSPNKTVATLLSGLNLSAGSYWLSFSGEDMSFDTNGTGNSGQVGEWALNSGGSPQNVRELGFRLYSASASVPESSGLILFGLGFAGLLLSRRKLAAA